MDRESGQPVAGAKAELIADLYQGGGLRNITLGSAITDTAGMAAVEIPKDQSGQQHWVITSGKDRISTQGNYFYRNNEDVTDRDSLRTFIFTDRAIYRPGQPVLFKGIVSVKRAGTTVVKAGYKTMVRFFDVNDQPVDSITMTTDAFGFFPRPIHRAGKNAHG